MKNEIADYIDRDSNNFRLVIESLYDGVKSGKIRIENSEVVVPVAFKERGKNSVELPEEVYQSLEETLEIDEISVEDFVKAVMEAIDNGIIWLENGKIVVENAQ